MTTVPQTPIAFKVELQRRGRDPLFHRFRGVYSYSELSTVISHLWGERPKTLVLEYTDDEDDKVRFNTEVEWVECAKIFLASAAPVLRLIGKRAKDIKKEERAAESESESDVEHLADISVVEDAHLRTQKEMEGQIQRDIQREHEPTLLNEATNDFLEAALMTDSPASSHILSAIGFDEPTMVREPSKTERDSSDMIIDLMSMVYGCDAGDELFKGATDKFGSTVKRLVNPSAPTEVHLDIDRSNLCRDVVAKARTLTEARRLIEAEQLLRTAVTVFSSDVGVLQYSLAGVLSLQNNLEESLDMLFVARTSGYEMDEALRSDADFANVRKHPRFVEVLPPAEPNAVDDETLFVYEPEPNDAVPELPAFVPAPFPFAAAPCAPKVECPQVVNLMSMFSEMTAEEANAALVQCEFDICKVIDKKFAAAPTAPSAAAGRNCWAPVQPVNRPVNPPNATARPGKNNKKNRLRGK